MFSIDVEVPDPEIPFTCPKCSQKTSKKLSWLAHNDTFHCVCGVKVAIEREQFLAAHKALNSLKNIKL